MVIIVKFVMWLVGKYDFILLIMVRSVFYIGVVGELNGFLC